MAGGKTREKGDSGGWALFAWVWGEKPSEGVERYDGMEGGDRNFQNLTQGIKWKMPVTTGVGGELSL